MNKVSTLWFSIDIHDTELRQLTIIRVHYLFADEREIGPHDISIAQQRKDRQVR